MGRLRLEPNPYIARAPTVYAIRPKVVAKKAHEPVLGRAHPSMAHTAPPIHACLAVPTAARCSEPPRQWRHEPWHLIAEPRFDEVHPPIRVDWRRLLRSALQVVSREPRHFVRLTPPSSSDSSSPCIAGS